MKHFFLALRFLTIWPWGRCDDVTDEDLAVSTVFYPIVGILMGILFYYFHGLLRTFWAAMPAAVLTVALWEAISAGLHLDGLIDTFDGLGVRGNRKKRLEVMKDSRVGAFGVQAAVIAMLLKAAAIGSGAELFLILSPLAGRTVMVVLMATTGYARSGEGLGRAFTEGTGHRQLAAVLLVFLLLSYLLLGQSIITVIPVLAVIFFAVQRFILVNFGGVTGDILGASCEFMEIVVLLLMPFY